MTVDADVLAAALAAILLLAAVYVVGHGDGYEKGRRDATRDVVEAARSDRVTAQTGRRPTTGR